VHSGLIAKGNARGLNSFLVLNAKIRSAIFELLKPYFIKKEEYFALK